MFLVYVPDARRRWRNEDFATNSAPARWPWSPWAGRSVPDFCWDRPPLSKSPGPGVILSFVLAAFITLTVTLALGELSSMHPAAGSFGVYGDLYLNQWAGFIARAGYWAAISISIGAELVASATYLAYWFPSVPALFWVVIFSVAAAADQSAQRGQLRPLRILVCHDQGRNHRCVRRAGSGIVAEWPSGAAIHGARRIPSQGSAGAPAGHGLRALHLWRSRICRHHHRRVALAAGNSSCHQADLRACWLRFIWERSSSWSG